MIKLFTKKRKWLIVPVEVKARELESRLLLSLLAVEHGYGVVFGNQRTMLRFINQLPRGIYFEKSISANKYDTLKNISDRGFVLTGIDEEGMPKNMGGYFYIKHRISQKTLDLLHKFFTWGKEEKDAILNKFKIHPGQISDAGNPRVDIWSGNLKTIFEKEARKHKETHGEYILMPTNFASNHVNGAKFLISQAKDYGTIENDEEENLYREFLKISAEALEKHLELIKELAQEFKNKKIIVRPHPAENSDFWHDKLKNIENVKVIREGGVTPWILGADVVIHSSCTTGLEGFLMGKPVISYMPMGKSEIRAHVSDEISYQAATPDETIKAIKEFEKSKNFNAKNKSEEKMKQLAKSISIGDGTSITKSILEELSTLPTKEDSFKPSRFALLCGKRLLQKQNKPNKYILQKFPGTTKKEIHEIAKSMTPKPPKIKKIADSLYVIYR